MQKCPTTSEKQILSLSVKNKISYVNVTSSLLDFLTNNVLIMWFILRIFEGGVLI